MYDLIIIGAGPAGITAAVYAARKRLNFLVVTKDIGGQTAISGAIENYTGYQFITGPDLTAKFDEHMRQSGAAIKEGEEVTDIQRIEGGFRVKTNAAEYDCKSVIIASGKRPRLLGIPGEHEFKNRGVSYCATCDAPLFANRDVAVIGGGNSALDAALQLIKIANKIYLININPTLTADEAVMREKVEASPKVAIFNSAKTRKIEGDKVVKSITIEHEGKMKELAVSGVFIEIGSIPAIDFAKLVTKNSYNEIVVDNYNRTDVPGLFAAGDVTDVPEKQIVIAAGEGAKAALGVFRYLAGLK